MSMSTAIKVVAILVVIGLWVVIEACRDGGGSA